MGNFFRPDPATVTEEETREKLLELERFRESLKYMKIPEGPVVPLGMISQLSLGRIDHPTLKEFYEEDQRELAKAPSRRKGYIPPAKTAKPPRAGRKKPNPGATPGKSSLKSSPVRTGHRKIPWTRADGTEMYGSYTLEEIRLIQSGRHDSMNEEDRARQVIADKAKAAEQEIEERPKKSVKFKPLPKQAPKAEKPAKVTKPVRMQKTRRRSPSVKILSWEDPLDEIVSFETTWTGRRRTRHL